MAVILAQQGSGLNEEEKKTTQLLDAWGQMFSFFTFIVLSYLKLYTYCDRDTFTMWRDYLISKSLWSHNWSKTFTWVCENGFCEGRNRNALTPVTGLRWSEEPSCTLSI